MAIKVTTSEQETPKDKGFPKLMYNPASGTIILATGTNGIDIQGFKLGGAGGVKQGEFSGTWNGLGFEYYEGSITLTNE